MWDAQSINTERSSRGWETLGVLASELEGCIIVKPYTTELQNGTIKYLWIRDGCASATTWEEAFKRTQDFYDEESDKACGDVYYVRAGLTQGKPLKEE
jgi:hypothetical protein